MARLDGRDGRPLHGQCRRGRQTREHAAWSKMWGRCANPNDAAHKRYGGRGITVSARWWSFEQFFNDMGRKPSPSHSLDRIDNDGNYEPGNCRWATRSEQNRNRDSSLLARGERIGNARLTAADVKAIKGLLSGHSRNQIARLYGVTKGTINFIAWGRTWRHVA